jgi:hypothetical protein
MHWPCRRPGPMRGPARSAIIIRQRHVVPSGRWPPPRLLDSRDWRAAASYPEPTKIVATTTYEGRLTTTNEMRGSMSYSG